MYGLEIDRNSELTLAQQLYHQLRQLILSGRLPANSRLPATRRLSEHLHIARNIVVDVYEQLRAEGFLDSRPGSYTRVAPDTLLTQEILPLSAMLSLPLPSASPLIDFRPGVPDLREFPRKYWLAEMKRVLLDAPDQLLDYGDPAGCPDLRNALPSFLLQSRGVRCRPEQLVITAGSTQALALVVRLLTQANPNILVENPLNKEMQRYLAVLGCRPTALDVDRQGLQTDLLPWDSPSPPAFTLVTPSHQFPTGGILPIQRRIQLIHFARQSGSYIVEDDYENEFTHGAAPVSSLQGLAPDTVFYVGTFSKALAPALRLGYLVLPLSMVKKFQRLDWFAPQQPSPLDQLVLRSFIVSGRLARHIAKVGKLYKKKRLCLIQALRRNFGETVLYPENAAGLHLTVEFPGFRFDFARTERIAQEYGVRIHAVSRHVLGLSHPAWLNQIILGYGNLTESQIVEGVSRLSRALYRIADK